MEDCLKSLFTSVPLARFRGLAPSTGGHSAARSLERGVLSSI